MSIFGKRKGALRHEMAIYIYSFGPGGPEPGAIDNPCVGCNTKCLVISPKPEHSGSELCQSPTSRGPDFISPHEGIFYDMDSKTAFPLCNDHQRIKTNYFELLTNSLVLASPMRQGGMPKVYDSVENW